MRFADDFLAHVKNTGAPLDFFSWHSYASVGDTEIMADYVERLLDKYDLAGIETQLNEWNNAPSVALRGSSHASAYAAAMMIALQYKKTDILCYYDARIGQSVYGGLFDPPDLQAALYILFAQGVRRAVFARSAVAVDCPKRDGIYALGATDGTRRAAMIVNTGKETRLNTNLTGRVYLVDRDHMLEETDLDPADFVSARIRVALVIG